MQRRFRVSPSMVLAALSLAVAVSCLLYVMERPGMIAVGSTSLNGARVIALGYIGPVFAPGDPAGRDWARNGWSRYYEGSGDYGEPQSFTVWDSVKKTVPKGKVWIVIVSPVDKESSGHPFEIFGRFVYTYPGGSTHWEPYLSEDTYEDLDLVIYLSVPVAYLVLEVDSELEG